MSFSLLNIASSGVRANTELLETASKNIANVNTEGYVRERTEYTTTVDNQVGQGDTYRLLNSFAQDQLNRDTSNKTYFDQFLTEASRVDTLFSQDANSLSTSINTMFNSVQEALNQPTSSVTRSLVMSDAESLVDQMDRLSTIVYEQSDTVNSQLEILSEEANTLIQNISELNKTIAGVDGTSNEAGASSAYNERDLAIRELAELIDIETLETDSGEKLVFMGTGESLVMENGTFNLFSLQGDPDPDFKELYLDVDNNKAVPLQLDSTQIKGEIGGLLAFRDEILVPAQNQIGQMGLVLADSFNTQNALGMDANGELGGDIFTIPSVNALPYQSNTGSASMTATLEAGQGSELPASDFLITFTSATTVEIQPVDNYGDPLGDPSVADISSGILNSDSITTGESFGLELEMTGTAAAGDQFQVKLNSFAASNISLATNDGSDLALASPIRGLNSIDNTSEASITISQITDVTTGSFTTSPTGLTNGEITITKTANDNEYTISDSVNSTTVTITPPAENILSQAGGSFADYGFDFDLEGTAETGDVFTIEFNEGGFDDNRNGLALAQLQNDDLVRQNVVSSASADNHNSFNQAYTNLVTDIGIITSQAQTNSTAFTALAEQSEAWYESLSGVNLDEEAANLIRFQQSYAASAQVLATSQTIFDSLLSAAR
ncbi:flagellar hook-associated protein FlgK [Pseudoalteromonas sp. MMG010]|uniref:flagellar hook-associated protein FlgK n=1 Tax=Pseudoalteromonas sp. MMG010 TaxID=2822685 RepID=UPI001B3A0748|nr:flagellar hook-associated protein FlgK [Pseudoalteromonas sp. MMG010]MBQ4831800.1 flagellar hook-associated protein FlgK [Pseudoalteromonas sp. MMG010]